MKLVDQKEAIKSLRDAFSSRDLTIYLGAGVSIPSGLPSWEQLVLLLYFRTLDADISYKVYPNYLMAISEWLIKNKNEPLDIIIRKVKNSGWDETTFFNLIRESLYSGFNLYGNRQRPLIEGNKTLNAIINFLCSKSIPQNSGLKSIISYNYDNLLEIGLESITSMNNYQIIWKGNDSLELNKIPIYHVHGFIPFDGNGSAMNEMIFSEEQYNNAFQDAFFWGNMIQMQNLSSNTGLMIGISLSDRNIRRILDAIKKTPVSTRNYLLLQKSKFEIPSNFSEDINWIHAQAFKYGKKLENSGAKVEEKEFDQIVEILNQINNFESETFNRIYDNIGLEVLWYDDHDEVAEFIKVITN
jgi:hypothetical protein